MTARRALAVLESEGLIYTDGPRGTFVAEPRTELDIDCFSQVGPADKNQSVDLHQPEQRPASLAQSGMFGIDPGSAVFVLKRILRSGNTPLALQTTYLPAAYNPGLLDLRRVAARDDLKMRYSSTAVRSISNLEAIMLDTVGSELLRTRQNAGALRVSERIYDKTGRCIEYTERIFRADRVSLVIERPLLPE